MKIYFNHKEEVWNSWSHGIGIVLGLVAGTAFLVWCGWARNGWATAGIILYLFGMLSSYIIDCLSCHLCLVAMEGAAAQVGPCSHLLAYSRLLLANNACGIA